MNANKPPTEAAVRRQKEDLACNTGSEIETPRYHQRGGVGRLANRVGLGDGHLGQEAFVNATREGGPMRPANCHPSHDVGCAGFLDDHPRPEMKLEERITVSFPLSARGVRRLAPGPSCARSGRITPYRPFLPSL